MFKRLKTINLLLAITTAFFVFACISGADPIEPRTPETEAAELQGLFDLIDEDGKEVFTTDLGVYYIVDSLSDGDFAQPGDTCHLAYVGYLLNGVVFDASNYHYESGIWKFVYRDPELTLIPGFEDGIGSMNKGARITIIIPSELAYGASGKDNIPPYSTLIFDLNMHDLKPPL